MTTDESERVLIARGAADADGTFVAVARLPAPVSGRVRVDVVAMASAGEEVPGITSSSPLIVESRFVDGSDVRPMAFGPADDEPAVWPWFLLTMVASGCAGAAATWRLMGRRRPTADTPRDHGAGVSP
jgi:hypothetical protein